jgi:hypothetical protein
MHNLTCHLEGEEVFGCAKHNIDYFLRASGQSHKLDHVKFSYPHVAILAFQPHTIENLHVHALKEKPLFFTSFFN